MTRSRILALAETVARGKALEHQLAIRMTKAEYARLERVAKAHALRPATFARVLIQAGLDEIEEVNTRRSR